MPWTQTKDKLPAINRPVLFLLSGAPGCPHIGYIDTPERLFERTGERLPSGCAERWWCELEDDSDVWEMGVVTHWYPLPPLPRGHAYSRR